MIIKICDMCGKEIPIVNTMMPVMSEGKLMISVNNSTHGEESGMNLRTVDLCKACDKSIYDIIFNSKKSDE